MRTSCLLVLFCGLASSVEYGALEDVLAKATVQTLRLTEIQAKVESQGPMDQVGALCYQQMREISQEVQDLDATHSKFTSACVANKNMYKTTINRLALSVATHDKHSSKLSAEWNNLRPLIPPIKRRRERDLKKIKGLELRVIKHHKRRVATKKIYDSDMVDFAQALKDVDDIKKILLNSNLGNKQTSSNTATQGFLEACDNVKSDRFKAMTNRLTRGALFLQEKDVEGAPSGMDKLMNLLLKVRNELWAEMDKLTSVETRSISVHKRWLLRTRRYINYLHVRRAREYILIGSILSNIGRLMVTEANHRIASATHTRRIDNTQIHLDFLTASCGQEPPRFQKMRSNKMDEIKTIQMMIKILQNLNWSGAVYSAIARISVAGVDENPEPGYQLGWQMNLQNGVTNNYAIQDRNNQFKGFGRVAVHLQIGSSWVWASFDSFNANSNRYLIPTKQNGMVNDRYVSNLHVFKSPSANVKTSENSAKGNVEIWGTNYGKINQRNIPGASSGAYDFGDQRVAHGTYGCFQIHDYLQKQTVLAINNLFRPGRHDIGIGSQVQGKNLNSPDWTFADNWKTHKARKDAMIVTWWFQTGKAVLSKGDGVTGTTRTTGNVDAKALAAK